MTESIDNPIPEYLRHIRGRVDHLAEDMTDVRHRMTFLETEMALAKREVTVAADRAHAVLEALSGFDDEFVALLEADRASQPAAQNREGFLNCLLDTHILIYLIKNKPPSVARRIDALGEDTMLGLSRRLAAPMACWAARHRRTRAPCWRRCRGW